MGEDFTAMVVEFFHTGVMPREVNTTWVSLIPKVEGVCEPDKFRPISTVGCVYKVIAKLLARRLKPVLLDLVGETQTAFVQGRQILDGALIANETIH